jgi:hypothetical protein
LDAGVPHQVEPVIIESVRLKPKRRDNLRRPWRRRVNRGGVLVTDDEELVE